MLMRHISFSELLPHGADSPEIAEEVVAAAIAAKVASVRIASWAAPQLLPELARLLGSPQLRALVLEGPLEGGGPRYRANTDGMRLFAAAPGPEQGEESAMAALGRQAFCDAVRRTAARRLVLRNQGLWESVAESCEVLRAIAENPAMEEVDISVNDLAPALDLEERLPAAVVASLQGLVTRAGAALRVLTLNDASAENMPRLLLPAAPAGGGGGGTPLALPQQQLSLIDHLKRAATLAGNSHLLIKKGQDAAARVVDEQW